jgi:predicted transcriptional regulator
MKKTTTNKPTTARLSIEILKEIEAMASKLKVSRSFLIRAAIEQGFPLVKATFGKGAA